MNSVIYHDVVMTAFVDELQKMAAESIEKDAGLAALKAIRRAGSRVLRGGGKTLAQAGRPTGVAQRAVTSVPTPAKFIPGRTPIPGFQAAAGGRARLHRAALQRAGQAGQGRLTSGFAA